MDPKKARQTWLQRLEGLPTYQTMLYLAMLGSGLIFLYLAVAFLLGSEINSELPAIRMPIAFLISTAVLILSGLTVADMKVHCQNENLPKLTSALRTTLLMGVVFTILQLVGWKELTETGVKFTGIATGSYLYLLSGIHIVHLLGAMIFAIILLTKLRKSQKDQVQNLLWITNPFEQMRIRLFITYWRFMELIWIGLFLIIFFKIR